VAGGAAIANFIVGPGAKFGAELECMLPLCPGERVEDLLIGDRCLESENRAWVTEGGVTGDGKCRESGVADAGETDLGCKIFFVAGPPVDEFSSQIRVSQFVGDVAAEQMRIGSEQALNADIGRIAKRICDRNSVSAGGRRSTVVDVVASREQVCRPELMIEA